MENFKHLSLNSNKVSKANFIETNTAILDLMCSVMVKLNLASYSEVLSKAIQLVHLVIYEKSHGCRLIIVDKNGDEVKDLEDFI